MADSKITALTALTAADPANDMIPIVDVSDTPPASGNTKRISINNILACSPTATLASATITGDLTVDTNVLKVDTSNNRVGIGTTSLFGDLNIQTGSNCRLEIYSQSGGTTIENLNNARNAYLNMTMYADAYIWNRLGSEAMRLNSTGLGVGLSAHVYKLQSVGFVAASSSTVNGSGGNLIGALLNSDDANSGVNPGLDLRRWTGTALNHGLTYIATNATGDTLFYNGTAASNTRATSLKMTLDASGNLLVGKTASSTTVAGSQVQTDGTHSAVKSDGNPGFFYNTTTAISGTIALFRSNGVTVGSITQDGTNTSYVTSSDYRLKDSIQPLSGGLARVNLLKPSIYTWKTNGSSGEGFLAHELAEVVPAAVVGIKDAVDADGNPIYQGVDLSKVVPILVAAIKELTAEVNALKNA
jgi:hypothetical protein